VARNKESFMNKAKRCTLAAVVSFALLTAVTGFPPHASYSQSRSGGLPETYIVLYKLNSVPADAANAIGNAGGALVKSYNAIGVAIATSADPSFRNTLLQDGRIEGAASTARFAVKLHDDLTNEVADLTPANLLSIPATDNDSLSGLQWDMIQIHTPEAHAISGGDPSVVVGNIDTGIDYTHPDLAPNFDFANSCSCIGGVPNQSPAAFNDDNGHGTHTAGTIAAASNGIGIVGVAPNVKIAAIKAGNGNGFFYPEAVVCAFMWAADHHLDVTNNSYFADPWVFNCKNDPDQRAIWKAEQRAIRYAMSQGVTVVATAGNLSDDLAHPQVDPYSPVDGTPIPRDVTNACLHIPVEIPGVIGVSADGNALQNPAGYLKSYYSSYGIGVTQLVAPGGDSVFGLTAAAPNGRVLSTWPAAFANNCPPPRRVVDASGALYCYVQGTSMAAPHVTGVAALIISQLGTPRRGGVASVLTRTADPQPCPTSLPAGYLSFTRPSGDPQNCQGGPSLNSWYGHGQVNALRAVSGVSDP
jgi:lantibiotic leader peptide-processing serine protease